MGEDNQPRFASGGLGYRRFEIIALHIVQLQTDAEEVSSLDRV